MSERREGLSVRVQVRKDGVWYEGILRGWHHWTPEAARGRGGGRKPGWWGSVEYRAPSERAGGYMSNWVLDFHADDIRRADDQAVPGLGRPPGTS